MKWKKVVTSDGLPESLQDRWAQGYIVMPYVSGGAPGVATRINESFFLQVLNAAAPVEPDDTFSLADPPFGLDSVSFKVRRNDEKVLAVEVSGSGCGASCSESQVEYHFDARNGHELAISDLFTSRGQAIIAKRMNAERLARYKAEVRRLTGELRALRKPRKKADAERIAELEEALATNRSCADRTREEREETAGGPSPNEDGLHIGELHLDDPKRVSFRTDPACEGIDSRDTSITLGSIDLNIPVEDSTDLLSRYGKALLLDQGEAPPPHSPFGQLLFGRIGARTVTARFDRPYSDGSFAAIYFYDKYRRAIELSGRMKGVQVELVEKLKEGGSARFFLTEKGGGFVGTWSGKDKQLPVTLHR